MSGSTAQSGRSFRQTAALCFLDPCLSKMLCVQQFIHAVDYCHKHNTTHR